MLIEAINKALRGGQAIIIHSIVGGGSVQLVRLPPEGGVFVPDSSGRTLQLQHPVAEPPASRPEDA